MLSYEAYSPHGGRLITCSLLLPTDFETDSVDISFPDVSGVPVRDFLVNLPDGIQKAKFNLPEVHFDAPRWNLDGALQGTLLYPLYACMTIWSDGTFYGACPSLNFMSCFIWWYRSRRVGEEDECRRLYWCFCFFISLELITVSGNIRSTLGVGSVQKCMYTSLQRNIGLDIGSFQSIIAIRVFKV